MYLLYFMVFGVAVYETSFPKFTLLGVPITYILMLVMLISYVRFLMNNKDTMTLNKGEKSLLLFVLYGLLMVFVSFIGLNSFFISSDLLINNSYIARQAYYLFLLPSIILFKEGYYTDKFSCFIKKYGSFIFWFIYFYQFIVQKQFVISLSAEIVLGWLSFSISSVKLTRSNLLRLAVLLFTPTSGGGGSTNMMIRLIIISLLLFYGSYKSKLFTFLRIALAAMIAMAFILPLFLDYFSNRINDMNSLWRLNYWRDELIQLAKSFFLGVGYGTSYASIQFVGNSFSILGGPFGSDDQYSTMEKMFVVGSHCSFISVAFRTGIIGISAFLLFLSNLGHEMQTKCQSASSASVFAFCSAIILICFNVGLESPSYLIVFIFMIGMCISEVNKSTVLGGK